MRLSRFIFIIISFAFIIRLFNITTPPLEISHNWRQAFTLMVAGNFDHTSILRPIVDAQGGKYVAGEFPLFSYLIFIANDFLGEATWYGRLINLLASSAGLFYFFLVVRKLFDERLAFFSTVLLTFSLFFEFSRKSMPDTFTMSVMFAGVYYLLEFLYSDKPKIIFLLAGSILIAAGTLSKIPCILVLVFLLPALSDKAYAIKQKIILLLFLLPSAILAYIWYVKINDELLQEGALGLIFPAGFTNGIRLTGEHIFGVAEKFYFNALESYVATLLFICGLYFMIAQKQIRLIFLFLVSLFVFLIFVIQSADFFYFHNYYVIPFIPFMAVVAGYGVTNIIRKNKRAGIFLLILASAEAILNQQHDFFIHRDQEYKATLTAITNKVVNPGEKVLLNTGPSVQQLYFAHRKGWTVTDTEMISREFLIKTTGATDVKVILDRHLQNRYVQDDFIKLFSNDDYVFLKAK
jgi:4-amino-4-deoxy-L-arabinose transferase-like glycosyltransferase